jgi:hypothetical protein
MAKPKKVVFYFPWEEVSGGPYYLTRLADKLADDADFEVYYTDYKNGLSDQLLSNPLVKKIEVSKSDFCIHMDNCPIILITPIYWACWLPLMHPDSKILFFNWHNSCIPVLQSVWSISNKELDAFLRIVASTDSVFFADYSHRMAQNTDKIVFKENYVPIIMQQKKISAKSELIKADEINVAVLGRLCLDKIYSIIDLLNHFNKIKTICNKNIYIIGSGDEKEKISLDQFPNLNVYFVGTITGQKLDDFLSSKVDILFAMGTSVLEGAAIRLPSVIIPHNVVPFSCDKYVYVQNTKKYCLGWYDTQLDELNLHSLPLEQIIDDVYLNNKKKILGEEAYSYFAKKHIIEHAVGNLKQFIDRTSLTYEHFNKFTHKIYKKQKRWRVLGFSIITLYKNNNNDCRINIFNHIPIFYYKRAKIKKETVLYLWSIPLLVFTSKKNGAVTKINLALLSKISKWVKGKIK